MKRIVLIVLGVLLGTLLPHLVFGADDLTDAVNVERTRHGLHSLAHEPSLAAWAAENNRYGFGHTIMGPAHRQCAAWGQRTIGEAVGAWMASPAHRAALLAYDVTHCGGAFDGSVWTWNASGYPPPPPGLGGPPAPPTWQPKTVESKPQQRPAGASPQTGNGNLTAACSKPAVPDSGRLAPTQAPTAACSNVPVSQLKMGNRCWSGRRGLFRRCR